MRQRVVLHIGTHRTASTSLQTWLWLNRPALSALGVWYPRPQDRRGFRGAKHGDLRLAALAEGRQGARGRFEPLLSAYIEAIAQRGAPITVLSCEGWSARENHFAPRFAPLAERFDVTVVVFVRRPDFWLESMYRHRMRLVEHAETRLFTQFAAARQQQDYVTGRSVMLGWWAEVFGPRALRLIPYCPAVPGFDPIKAFQDAAELPSASKWLLGSFRRNKGLTREQAEAVRRARLQGFEITRTGLSRLRKHMRRGAQSFLGETSREALLNAASDDLRALSALAGRPGTRFFPEQPERLPEQRQDWDQAGFTDVPDPNTWCFPP